MKTKISLAAIQGKLSRAEMKTIMAGSGSNACTSLPQSDCNSSVNCTLENPTANGRCGWTAAWNRCTCGTAG